MTVDRSVRVVAELRGIVEEDPLGPGDPLDVARLVRRALAAAGRRAVDVQALSLVADVVPDPAALARFTRRALGPHGAGVTSIGRGAAGTSHEVRIVTATELAGGASGPGAGSGARPGEGSGGRVAIAVARGPGDALTVRCVMAGRS